MLTNLVLKNGLKFLLVEDKSLSATALGISVGAGTYFEDENKAGISHLLEHLIGRAKVDGGGFRETVYKNGGVLEASTSLFKTYYYLTCLPGDFAKLSQIVIDGVFKTSFDKENLKDSIESIISELAYMEDIEPYKILRDMMWKDTKLSKPITGSKSSILEIKISELESYYKKHYKASNATVVLLAPTLPAEFIDLLETVQTDDGYELDEINLETNAPQYRILQERNLKSAIALSFPTKGHEGMGEGRHYFNLAAGALTEIYMSTLASEGLIYDDVWLWNVFPKNGDFILFLDNIEHSHLLPTLKGVVEIIGDWTQKPFDQNKFEILKRHKILDLKTHTSIAEKIVLLTKSFSSSDEVHTYEEAIGVYEKADLKVTLESFNKILLTKKPFIVVSAGVDLENDISEIEKFLEKYYP